MVWFVITHIFSTLLELVGTSQLSVREKDLEILILRHQLDILERKQKAPRPQIPKTQSGQIQKRKVLGGIINDYYRTPANIPLYLN